MTIGAALPTDEAARASLIARLGEFARAGRAALEGAGFVVQTTRLSTQPAERWLSVSGGLLATVAELGRACESEGLDYWSLGTIQAQEGERPVGGRERSSKPREQGAVGAVGNVGAVREPPLQIVEALPSLVLGVRNVFASVQVGDALSGGVSLEAIRGAAACVKALAAGTPDGFGNLRFAAAANCPPHVPFFPASYYAEDERNGGGPEFGLALEAADLAVRAFEGAHSHEEARENLLGLLVEQGERAAQVCAEVGADHNYAFTGLDISMAPYPGPERSIGRALEMLNGAPLGSPGTLSAATFFTGVLKEARLKLPTTGYSGLMLPALEDQTLADRAAQGLVTLDTLLLMSAVCGLGLDTVPLPGDVSSRQLERIILDMASLAVRLDKPLTARLLPVPGKRAGEPAEWPDFPFFTRGRVMGVADAGEGGLFGGNWVQF